jgi:hypothetical protein
MFLIPPECQSQTAFVEGFNFALKAQPPQGRANLLTLQGQNNQASQFQWKVGSTSLRPLCPPLSSSLQSPAAAMSWRPPPPPSSRAAATARIGPPRPSAAAAWGPGSGLWICGYGATHIRGDTCFRRGPGCKLPEGPPAALPVAAEELRETLVPGPAAPRACCPLRVPLPPARSLWVGESAPERMLHRRISSPSGLLILRCRILGKSRFLFFDTVSKGAKKKKKGVLNQRLQFL